MKTLLLTIDETNIATNFEASLLAMAGIKQVRFLDSIPLSSAEWARPGIPATEEQIELSAIEAEASTSFFSVENLREDLHKKYKSVSPRTVSHSPKFSHSHY